MLYVEARNLLNESMIMPNLELQNLEKNINRLKEQLNGIRDAWTVERLENKVLLQQQINIKREEIKVLEQ